VDLPKPACFLRLYFPREIAQLRDAYQRDLKSQSSAGEQNEPQNSLPLSLSVTGNDDDSVAPYSPLQTPLSQESILQAIVAALRRDQAKVVIIRAADALDMVFLSRYLRQNYPQARLVTVGADLLMVHEFYDPRFHGILATTPYPLLAGAEFPSSVDSSSAERKPERLFPDSYTVGDYNAFQSLFPTPATSENYSIRIAWQRAPLRRSFIRPINGRPRITCLLQQIRIKIGTQRSNLRRKTPPLARSSTSSVSFT
jgi:hypothetical protein